MRFEPFARVGAPEPVWRAIARSRISACGGSLPCGRVDRFARFRWKGFGFVGPAYVPQYANVRFNCCPEPWRDSPRIRSLASLSSSSEFPTLTTTKDSSPAAFAVILTEEHEWSHSSVLMPWYGIFNRVLWFSMSCTVSNFMTSST